MESKSALGFLLICLLFAVRQGAAADSFKCYTCVGLKGSDCGEKFKPGGSGITEESCSNTCYKVTYEVKGTDVKSFARGCLSTGTCDDLGALLPFIKDIPNIEYEGKCCKTDKCNTASSLGMTKMAAFICSFMAIFAWWKKI